MGYGAYEIVEFSSLCIFNTFINHFNCLFNGLFYRNNCKHDPWNRYAELMTFMEQVDTNKSLLSTKHEKGNINN